MKNLLLLISLFSFSATLKASANDTFVDSLKHKISICANDTVRAALFTQLASHYMRYDTIANARQKQIYQENALGYTLEAIHQYSRYSDTLGLRNSYDVLTKIYHDEKKYTQAKWFILQSNSLSRAKNDLPNIITSLIELASIKTDIKDYSLAMRDLNEATIIATKNHYAKQLSAVQLGYAQMYSHMGNFTKANLALKKHVDMDDSIRKDEEARQLALTANRDSVQVFKKKAATSISKKPYKANSYKKTASLQFYPA